MRRAIFVHTDATSALIFQSAFLDCVRNAACLSLCPKNCGRKAHTLTNCIMLAAMAVTVNKAKIGSAAATEQLRLIGKENWITRGFDHMLGIEIARINRRYNISGYVSLTVNQNAGRPLWIAAQPGTL